MRYIAFAPVLMVVLFCMSCKNRTDMTPSAQTEKQDSLHNGLSDSSDSSVVKNDGITAEMAYFPKVIEECIKKG